MKKTTSLLFCKIGLLACVLLTLTHTHVTFAAYGSKDSVQGYIILITDFINYVILPLIFGIALLFFLINAVRYFIIGGSDTEGRAKAKRLALYGIGAFVFLVSIWGIVNMLVSGLGFRGNEAGCPDYIGDWCYSGGYIDYGGDYYEYYEAGYFYEPSIDELILSF